MNRPSIQIISQSTWTPLLDGEPHEGDTAHLCIDGVDCYIRENLYRGATESIELACAHARFQDMASIIGGLDPLNRTVRWNAEWNVSAALRHFGHAEKVGAA